MATKAKPVVKFYEVVDKKSSGFIMDGTRGTSYQQELTGPSIRWIPSEGLKAEQDANGKLRHVKIRYIKGCDSIDPLEQEKNGFRPNRFEDKIGIENGFFNTEDQASMIGLHNYCEVVFYNADAPNRPDSLAPIFRELKLDKKAVDLLDEDEMLTQAKSLVYELRLSTGSKTMPYKYNMDRIDAICRLVNVWDETPERKLILLINKANQNPKEFLETVVKAEQTVITEVSHALELNVINFDKSVAQYSEGNEIIYTVEGDKLKPEQKIEKLAAWLSTQDGNAQLTKMRAKLELAKDKTL